MAVLLTGENPFGTKSLLLYQLENDLFVKSPNLVVGNPNLLVGNPNLLVGNHICRKSHWSEMVLMSQVDDKMAVK
jgi:hypothetical protein